MDSELSWRWREREVFVRRVDRMFTVYAAGEMGHVDKGQGEMVK
jgi:hypothetical protein